MGFTDGVRKALGKFFSGVDVLFWTGLIILIILIIFFAVLIAQNGAKINDPDFADSKEYLKDQRTFFIVLLVFCSIALVLLIIYKLSYAKKYKEIIENEVERAISQNISEIAGQVAISAGDVTASVKNIADANFKAGLDVGVYYILPKSLNKYNNIKDDGKLSDDQIRNLVSISSRETKDINRNIEIPENLSLNEIGNIPFKIYDKDGNAITPADIQGYYNYQLSKVKAELEVVKNDFSKAKIGFETPTLNISNRVPIDLAYKIAKSEQFLSEIKCSPTDTNCQVNKNYVLDTLKRTNDIQCKPCGLSDGLLKERKSFEYGSPEYKYKAVKSSFEQDFSMIGPRRMKGFEELSDYGKALKETQKQLTMARASGSQKRVNDLESQLSTLQKQYDTSQGIQNSLLQANINLIDRNNTLMTADRQVIEMQGLSNQITQLPSVGENNIPNTI